MRGSDDSVLALLDECPNLEALDLEVSLSLSDYGIKFIGKQPRKLVYVPRTLPRFPSAENDALQAPEHQLLPPAERVDCRNVERIGQSRLVPNHRHSRCR